MRFSTEGEKDMLIHHYYDANRMGIATLQIRPLLWANDGWPLPGEPISKVEKQVPAVDKPKLAGGAGNLHWILSRRKASAYFGGRAKLRRGA